MTFHSFCCCLYSMHNAVFNRNPIKIHKQSTTTPFIVIIIITEQSRACYANFDCLWVHSFHLKLVKLSEYVMLCKCIEYHVFSDYITKPWMKTSEILSVISSLSNSTSLYYWLSTSHLISIYETKDKMQMSHDEKDNPLNCCLHQNKTAISLANRVINVNWICLRLNFVEHQYNV